MYSIIVLSHGDLTNGLKDTMMMILGEQEDIYFIKFAPSDSVEEFEKRVKVIYHSIPKERQVLFLCDLFGGTPSHIASTYRLRYRDRVEVISGVNMPLLMTAVLSKDTCLFDTIDHLVEECHKGVVRVEETNNCNEEDE